MVWLEQLWQQTTYVFTVELVKFGPNSISLLAIIQLAISILVVLFLCSAIKKFLKYQVLVKLKIDEGNREAIASIISYTFGTIAFLILLQTNGFNLASLAVLAGGLGVGIGLGLQEVTKNFTSGLTLLVERKIKVGDFIEFDHLSGYVKEISLRSTIIRTRDGGDVVVPNSHMVENRVINWSYDSYTARIHIPVQVAYHSDPLVVTETLLNSAYMEPAVVGEPAPRVVFKGFGESSLNFELWVWVNRIDYEPFIRSSLNFILEHNLRQNNIQIPFSQLEINLKSSHEINHKLFARDLNQDEFEQVKSQLSPTPNKFLTLKELLRQVTYFKNLTDLELRQLIEIGYRKRLNKSSILFREGDPGDAFYIILEGSVEVFFEKLEKHLATLERGKFFGELSLMLGIPRTATIRALEDTLLFAINNKGFEKLLKEHPELSEVIINELSKHQEELAQRQQQLRDMGLMDVNEDDKNPVAWMQKRLKNLFGI